MEALNLKENLTEKFVAFIDVMGFSNLVNADNVDRLESYFTSVNEILEDIRSDKGEIQSFLISDAIILIAPFGLKGLRDLIVATRRIQSALLWKKILLRGAISSGKIFYNSNKNIVVGKGFIRAYLLEKEANFPRIIIDPSIIKKVAGDKAEFMRLLDREGRTRLHDGFIYEKRGLVSQIQDDAIFVEYANKTIREDSLLGNIENIYDMIVENLYGDQKLYTKYVWLRNYFMEHLKAVSMVLLISPEHKNNVKIWLDKFERL